MNKLNPVCAAISIMSLYVASCRHSQLLHQVTRGDTSSDTDSKQQLISEL